MNMLYSREFVYPPFDGTVTLPETLDFHEKHNADLPIFVFNEEGTSEITQISFLEFSRACQRVAHLLRPDRRGPDGEIVAFIALTDALLYQAMTLGMMRAGMVPFPISPRNTPTAIAHMLKQTSCHRLITTQTTLKPLLDALKAELTESKHYLCVDEVPAFDNIYPNLGKEKAADPFMPYARPSRLQPLKDLALYLHSSGSTGFPKPIPQTYGTLVHWAAFPCTSTFRDHIPRVRFSGMHLPSFHTLGVCAQLLWTLYGCTTVALYPPTARSPESLPIMPSPDNILDHVRRNKCNAIITIPALIQVWAQDEGSVDLLRSLEFVSYSGGSLAPKLGDFLTKSGVRLSPGYGGTEFGSPTFPVISGDDREDWMWMRFSERCHVRWEPQGDGKFECQFLTTETHSLPIENVSDPKGYATSDLWEPHPTKEGLWKIVGRIDDVIIHSSGEKTVPTPMEDIIMSNPLLMGVVMFGREHDQAGILIEPKPQYAIDTNDPQTVQAFRNQLWPAIEEANGVAPAFSRIFKEMILITNRSKPLPRTAKGTVMRKMALKEYETEIEELYQTVESFGKLESVQPPKTWTTHHIRQWLMLQIEDLNTNRRRSPSADLFEQGFDSLSATILRRRISAVLQSSQEPRAKQAAASITQNSIYSHPTIMKLTNHIISLLSESREHDRQSEKVAGIENMISKYSSGKGAVVLLTGSTGNLGAQILELLLLDDRVEVVYAMNRPSTDDRTLLERHYERFVDKGFDEELLTSYKLVLLEGDLSSRGFGISPRVYDELHDSVNVVIHTAWRLDFNLSLSSFEPHIRGVRNLIDFVRSTPSGDSTKIMFTSSIASALSWESKKGPYPESVVADSHFSVGNGYGESKYVSERILANSELEACSLRIGQITGGYPNGAWAMTDWVPIMIKSSLKLGALPEARGFASWLSMDAVATSIIDLVFSLERLPPAINMVHPRPIPWSSIMQMVSDTLQSELNIVAPLPIIPFGAWFTLLEARSKLPEYNDQSDIPATKLLDFFRSMSSADMVMSKAGQADSEAGGIATFSVATAQRLSTTMRDMQPLSTEDVQSWIRYWNAAGFFN